MDYRRRPVSPVEEDANGHAHSICVPLLTWENGKQLTSIGWSGLSPSLSWPANRLAESCCSDDYFGRAGAEVLKCSSSVVRGCSDLQHATVRRGGRGVASVISDQRVVPEGVAY
jgi:hypothetical protein